LSGSLGGLADLAVLLRVRGERRAVQALALAFLDRAAQVAAERPRRRVVRVILGVPGRLVQRQAFVACVVAELALPVELERPVASSTGFITNRFEQTPLGSRDRLRYHRAFVVVSGLTSDIPDHTQSAGPVAA